MRVERNGIGNQEHTLIFTDAGIWIATVRTANETEVAEALAASAKGSHRPESEPSEKDA